MNRIIFSALFFIGLVAIWHLVVVAKIWSVVLLPDPITVWEYRPIVELGPELEASIAIFGILEKLCPEQYRTTTSIDFQSVKARSGSLTDSIYS